MNMYKQNKLSFLLFVFVSIFMLPSCQRDNFLLNEGDTELTLNFSGSHTYLEPLAGSGNQLDKDTPFAEQKSMKMWPL